MSKSNIAAAVAAGLGIVFAAHVATADSDGTNETASKTSSTSVVTNDNGTVTQTYTENNITTNGNMVTNRKRITVTTTDGDGNVCESYSSIVTSSGTLGSGTGRVSLPSHGGLLRSGLRRGSITVNGSSPLLATDKDGKKGENAEKKEFSFLGVKLGEPFQYRNEETKVELPNKLVSGGRFLFVRFNPEKGLPGFDEYYLKLTPKTHKVAEVVALAQNPFDPGWKPTRRGRRNSLVEALERRYKTTAEALDLFGYQYFLDLPGKRAMTVSLSRTSMPDYDEFAKDARVGREWGTMLAVYDDDAWRLAQEEDASLAEEKRKAAEAEREKSIEDLVNAL